MDVSALLTELYGRIPPLARRALEGVDTETLVRPPAPGANTIAWLVWHLTRIQDHHLSEILGAEQVYLSGEWWRRFRCSPDPSDTGYGHTHEQVLAVHPDGPEALLGYLDATTARTSLLLERLEPDGLERVVDERYDPPITLGVRLVSVASDNLQHLGQAAYARGILLG